MKQEICKCGRWYNTIVKCPDCNTIAQVEKPQQEDRKTNSPEKKDSSSVAQQLQEWLENYHWKPRNGITEWEKLKEIIQQIKELESRCEKLQLCHDSELGVCHRYCDVIDDIKQERQKQLQEFKKELQLSKAFQDFDALFKICNLADKYFGEKIK